MFPDPVNENDPSRPAACPTCGKPRVRAYRPFCSPRCADVDLQGWLTERYAIPIVEKEDGLDDPEAEEDAGQGGRGSL